MELSAFSLTGTCLVLWYFKRCFYNSVRASRAESLPAIMLYIFPKVPTNCLRKEGKKSLITERQNMVQQQSKVQLELYLGEEGTSGLICGFLMDGIK